MHQFCRLSAKVWEIKVVRGQPSGRRFRACSIRHHAHANRTILVLFRCPVPFSSAGIFVFLLVILPSFCLSRLQSLLLERSISFYLARFTRITSPVQPGRWSSNAPHLPCRIQKEPCPHTRCHDCNARIIILLDLCTHLHRQKLESCNQPPLSNRSPGPSSPH